MIHNKIKKLFMKTAINIFISKYAKFNREHIKIILSLFTNKNIIYENNKNINTDTPIEMFDIIITHICDRKKYYNENSLNIIFIGETRNVKIIYDISISTIRNFNSEYNFYYPFLYQSLFEHKKSISCLDYINTKKKFCAFMYSTCLQNREDMFHLISNYKHVDALGVSCKNIDIPNTRHVYSDTETYNDIAIQIYTDYKFVISMENKLFDGYFTEKLINPIIANSIPIYWGDSSAFQYINKKRIIYIPDYTSEELINLIRNIDNNDDLYNSIINENIYIISPDDILSDFKSSLTVLFYNNI